jgi:hypothetical protein
MNKNLDDDTPGGELPVTDYDPPVFPEVSVAGTLRIPAADGRHMIVMGQDGVHVEPLETTGDNTPEADPAWLSGALQGAYDRGYRDGLERLRNR